MLLGHRVPTKSYNTAGLLDVLCNPVAERKNAAQYGQNISATVCSNLLPTPSDLASTVTGMQGDWQDGLTCSVLFSPGIMVTKDVSCWNSARVNLIFHGLDKLNHLFTKVSNEQHNVWLQ